MQKKFAKQDHVQRTERKGPHNAYSTGCKGVALSFLQSVSLYGSKQTKACVTVREHLGHTVSYTAMLRSSAKLHLFPPIRVY